MESVAAPLLGRLWSRPSNHGRFRFCLIDADRRLPSRDSDTIGVEPFYFAFPALRIALFKQSGVSGNMAVPFDWGRIVLWHLGPRAEGLDRRQAGNGIFRRELSPQYRDFEQGTGVWDALLKSSKTDLVLAPNASPRPPTCSAGPPDGCRSLKHLSVSYSCETASSTSHRSRKPEFLLSRIMATAFISRLRAQSRHEVAGRNVMK